MFDDRVHLRPRPTARIWHLLRGTALWVIGIARNHFVFRGELWPERKLQDLIRDAILDNGRLAWQKTQKTQGVFTLGLSI